jgi:hypothetical protein
MTDDQVRIAIAVAGVAVLAVLVRLVANWLVKRFPSLKHFHDTGDKK